MAALTNDTTHLASANNALRFVSNNIDSNGWLQNTVDPYTFMSPTNASAGAVSPEGQAFVILMHAAWRDYVQFVIDSDTTPMTSTTSTPPATSTTSDIVTTPDPVTTSDPVTASATPTVFT
jgi:hypothetical protein